MRSGLLPPALVGTACLAVALATPAGADRARFPGHVGVDGQRLYRDVRKGDECWLPYRPGRGTELALNGAPLGAVEGADLAAAYFRIWLGERPVSTSLRKSLLGSPQGQL